jgi:pyrrolidone-carboxylate peptidase
VPVILSDNAGAYLCNFLFYGIMKKVQAEKDKAPHMLAGFVHVPGPEVVASADMTNAWKVMIESLATHQRELIATNGNAAPSSPSNQVLEIVHTPPQYK